MSTPADNRAHPRVFLERPAKVFHQGTRRYLPAVTSNISGGGVLIRVLSPRPLDPGDRLDVLIAWSNRTVLSSSDRVAGSVTRAARGASGEQFVAVAFDKAMVSAPAQVA